MPRSHRNYVPYFDEEFSYGDDTPLFKAGCRSLMMLSGGAIVIIFLGLPFWTAYQIGSGAFGRHGCLVRGISLVVSVATIFVAMLVFIVDAFRLLQVILSHNESQFTTWMTLLLMFSFVYLSFLGLSYLVGYMKRSDYALG
ncbi:MAG: hypothetical protein IT320_20170 [Anaerolineae bacterium]|nr:hypothetical protein [Anaerolineae bacterium]